MKFRLQSRNFLRLSKKFHRLIARPFQKLIHDIGDEE
jgi:hypothetical protein